MFPARNLILCPQTVMWLLALLFLNKSAFSQNDLPGAPVVESVSVDTASGNVIINWTPSPSSDISYYIIYRLREDGESGDSIGWAPATSTSFTIGMEEAGDKSVSYSVAAANTSGNRSTIAGYHNTVFLTMDYDSCAKRMYLDWNQYDAWADDGTLVGYNVYLDSNGMGYNRTSYTQIMDGEAIPTQGYLDSVAENTGYCVFIQAVRQDLRKSTSNVVCYYTEMPRHPTWMNADYATVTYDGLVTGEALVKLSFSRDPAGETDDFVIKRKKNDPTDITYSLDTLNNVTDNPLVYYDTIVYDTVNYYYRLLALDACDAVVNSSNVAGNITLKADRPSDPYTIELSWSRYFEWDLDVNEYYIYRIQNDTNVILHDSVSNLLSVNEFHYSDNVESLVNQGISAQISYFILATENGDNPYYTGAESRSNIATIDITPRVYMPNAFTPDDDNLDETIRPILTFEPKDYRFIIYDRWGSRVFETSNSSESWDGTLPNGSKAIEGVYVYYLKLTTKGDIIVEKRGTIILIYP